MTEQRTRAGWLPCGVTPKRLIDDLGDLPEQLVDEIAHFFLAYKRREGHEVTVDGWGGADDARRVVEEGLARRLNK
jgi:inorganic pyrophosphatase